MSIIGELCCVGSICKVDERPDEADDGTHHTNKDRKGPAKLLYKLLKITIDTDVSVVTQVVPLAAVPWPWMQSSNQCRHMILI